jgi:hypothetical protein
MIADSNVMATATTAVRGTKPKSWIERIYGQFRLIDHKNAAL